MTPPENPATQPPSWPALWFYNDGWQCPIDRFADHTALPGGSAAEKRRLLKLMRATLEAGLDNVAAMERDLQGEEDRHRVIKNRELLNEQRRKESRG